MNNVQNPIPQSLQHNMQYSESCLIRPADFRIPKTAISINTSIPRTLVTATITILTRTTYYYCWYQMFALLVVSTGTCTSLVQ